MSNRPALLLVTRVQVAGKPRFRLLLTLPLWVVLGLLDVLDDYCEIAALFCSRVRYQTLGNGTQTLPGVLRTVSAVLTGSVWELAFETGPLDLVDVDVSEADGRTVKVRIFTW